MLPTCDTEETVRQLPDPELRSLIQRCAEAISSHKASIQEYEVYILAVLEQQQRNPLAYETAA